MAPKRRPVIDRFAEKVALTDSGRLAWIASTDSKGYGKFQVEPGRNGRLGPAHRWFYEYVFGPVVPELHIDHLCRNRLCVNPDHLEPVAHRENVLRGIGPTAINAQKSRCLRGHPYSAGNTYTNPTTGSRLCRACRREHDRNRRPRQMRKAA